MLIGICHFINSFFVRVFTRELLSRNETRPGMNSSLPMVKCFLLFTRFCRDEISSRDELIPVKKRGMKFHPGMKFRMSMSFLKNF